MSANPVIPTILWAPKSRGGAPSDTSFDRWLVVQTQEEKGVRRYVCHRESDLARQIPATLSAAFRIPPYFSVTIAVAGQEFPETAVASSAKLLASATRMEGGVEVMRVTVSLADRNALFKRQRVRSFWFGSLIAAAVLFPQPKASLEAGEEHAGYRTKAVLINLGWITLRRPYHYNPSKRQGRCPLDSAWGFVDSYSPELLRLSCRAAASVRQL